MENEIKIFSNDLDCLNQDGSFYERHNVNEHQMPDQALNKTVTLVCNTVGTFKLYAISG